MMFKFYSVLTLTRNRQSLTNIQFAIPKIKAQNLVKATDFKQCILESKSPGRGILIVAWTDIFPKADIGMAERQTFLGPVNLHALI